MYDNLKYTERNPNIYAWQKVSVRISARLTRLEFFGF